MITQITKTYFPDEAVITQASATLNDMGDKSISIQVKVAGNVTPNFDKDWEVEFQGERYIHAIRQPQASKGNDSICSVIDLTFQHWAIYQLRRFYFPKMAEIGSGTVSADSYIASLGVNLVDFIGKFKEVLNYYSDKTLHGEGRCFDAPIDIVLYGDPDSYDKTAQYIEISYTHIWDVLQKMYEVYGVRWDIKGNTIYVGYPTEEIAHQFEYGFEGGLLKVERQVQSTDIRNSLLGRGGSKNLPYRYFKDIDEHNPSFKADPDWIPELENIYFSELRGKTFRDYVKGWKAKHYDGVPMAEPTEAYIKGYNDDKFNPIEFVEDKASIEKYGLLQGGLENQEDIYPSIQGVEIDSIGRIDEVVAVQEILVDEVTDKTSSSDEKYTQEIKGLYKQIVSGVTSNSVIHCSFRSETFETADNTVVPYLISDPNIKATAYLRNQTTYCHGTPYSQCSKYNGQSSFDLDISNMSVRLYFEDSNEVVTDISKLQGGVRYYVKLDADVRGFNVGVIEDNLRYDGVSNKYWGTRYEILGDGSVTIDFDWVVKHIPYHGLVLKSNEDDYKTVDIGKNSSKTAVFNTDTFEVPRGGATSVSVPVNIVTTAQGLYNYETSVRAINTNTHEIVSAVNIPEGMYYLEVSVKVINNSTKTESFKVELLTTYITLPTDTEEYQPTFDVWVKNIWNTTINEGESGTSYVERVWGPILGDRDGNTSKIVFTTGMLSGRSDYEFEIVKGGIAYAGGQGIELDGVPAEWRITLAKSTAELEATGKYIPSTQINATKGDKFYFTGIDMPHEYVLWAEEKLDQRKADQLNDVANIKPTWVVQTDKVRLNQLQPSETKTLLESIKVGNRIRLADSRFIKGAYENLHIQSVTYSWQAGTVLLPDIEVVLSDKIATVSNPVAQIQGQVDSLAKQVGSISNIQQVVRAVGDKLYLRKDGTDETSNSLTTFNKEVRSKGYRQGAVGGRGWGLRYEQGKGILELDKLIVRDEMQVNTLVVNQVAAVGGKQILSAANIVCSKVEFTKDGIVCYFDQKRGSVANLFVIGDIAYSQVFNATNNEVKYYKREVVGIADNSITLASDGDGSGAPQVGDVIVQYGNTTNANRQYVIITDVIGGGYERMISGLNSVFAKGDEYYFAGRLDGQTPRWFVGNETQFIEYKDGHLQVQADVTLGSKSTGLSNIAEFQTVSSMASEAKDYINNELPKVLGQLQDQLDGKVESFFDDEDPTRDTYPASEWIANGLEAEHLNDTFTNVSTGRSWRWLWVDAENMYDWVEIADTQASEALAKAQEALNIANGKCTTFLEQPYPPYFVGDFWIDEADNRIKVCVNSRASGEFNEYDWRNADDSKEYANTLVNSAKQAINKSIADAEARANSYADMKAKAEADGVIDAAEQAVLDELEKAMNEAKEYADNLKADLEKSLDTLDAAKADAQDVYTKVQADDKITESEQALIEAYEAYVTAAAKDLEIKVNAYTDGKISEVEEDLVSKANEAVDAAKAYADELASALEDDYISADEQAKLDTLAKAAEDAEKALNAAISALQNEYSYLKNAFKGGTILDVNGVTLSSLIGVKDNNDNVVAGLYGGTSEVLDEQGYKDESNGTLMLFAGAENASSAKDADFRVYENGKIVAKNAEIEGTVNANRGSFKNAELDNVTVKGSMSAPFAKFEGTLLQVWDSDNEEYLTLYRDVTSDAIFASIQQFYAWKNPQEDTLYTRTTDIHDGFTSFYTKKGGIFIPTLIANLKVIQVHNKINGYGGLGRNDNVAITVDSTKRRFAQDELSWDPSNSGRVVRLVNAPYDSQETVGWVKLYAPKGKYFIEDGARYSELKFSNQILELIGYGTPTDFYGWIVLNRKDVNTEKYYGSAPKVLCQGVIRANKLARVWLPDTAYSRETPAPITYAPSTGDVHINLPLDLYQGIDSENWEIICSGAVVKQKIYGKNEETNLQDLAFRLSPVGSPENIVFQVVSTADWFDPNV